MRTVGSRGRQGVQSALVVAEIAIALALIASSGLALRSFYGLTHADLGIRTDGIVATDIYALPDRRFPTNDAKREAIGRLSELLQVVPSRGFALASSYPTSNATIEMALRIANHPYDPTNQPTAELDSVTPRYFDVLSIPLQRGRAFTDADTSASAPVAIVNASFARYLHHGEDVVGQRVQIHLPNQPGNAPWRTIVGEVADDRDGPLAQPQPMVYLPMSQAPMPWVTAVLVSTGTSASQTQISNSFAKLDPLAEPPQISTLQQRLGDSQNAARLSAALLTALAAIALCLAIAGIFAIVSYSVSQRFQEFGIRMAIGSTAGAVVRNVLASVILLVAIGVSLGLILAAFAGRAMIDQLYAVEPTDPIVLTSVTLLLVAAALASAALPALRAARIDPARALRYE